MCIHGGPSIFGHGKQFVLKDQEQNKISLETKIRILDLKHEKGGHDLFMAECFHVLEPFPIQPQCLHRISQKVEFWQMQKNCSCSFRHKKAGFDQYQAEVPPHYSFPSFILDLKEYYHENPKQNFEKWDKTIFAMFGKKESVLSYLKPEFSILCNNLPHSHSVHWESFTKAKAKYRQICERCCCDFLAEEKLSWPISG